MTETAARAPSESAPSRQLVSFVLPVYNESPSLELLHEGIARVMRDLPYDYELLFVDDGSSDESFEVLARLQAADPHVRALQFRRNFGKSAAYCAGFDHARGDIVITMDTDLQDDPAEIPLFLDKMAEGHDMVIGWKYLGKGPMEKSVPSKLFNRVVRYVTGIELHDFNCPFKAYRREVLQEIHVRGELHRYIPVLAGARGFTFTEIKISNLPRQHGHSHYGYKRYVRGFLDLMTVVFITRFSERPQHLLGLGGIAAGGLGVGTVGFFVAAHFLFKLGLLTDRQWIIHDRPAISLGILLALLGAQFFSIGLLGELVVSAIGSMSSNRGYSVKRVVEHDPDADRP